MNEQMNDLETKCFFTFVFLVRCTEHIINTTTPTPTTANNNNKVHNSVTIRPWSSQGKDDTIFLILNIKNIV